MEVKAQKGGTARAKPHRVCICRPSGVVVERFGLREVNKLAVRLEACNDLAHHESTPDFRMGYVAALTDLASGVSVMEEPLTTVEAAYVRESSAKGTTEHQLNVYRTAKLVARALEARDE